MISKASIEDLLDETILRPISHEEDEVTVRKKQLVRLVKLAYEAGVRDTCGVLRDTPMPSFGELLADALETRLLGEEDV